jgi:hypothetical protein
MNGTSVFETWSITDRYPYLPPCAVAAGFVAAVWILAVVALKEVPNFSHPNAHHNDDLITELSPVIAPTPTRG